MNFQEMRLRYLTYGLFKGAPLHLEVETVLTEDFEDLYYNLLMLFFSLTAENTDVVL